MGFVLRHLAASGFAPVATSEDASHEDASQWILFWGSQEGAKSVLTDLEPEVEDTIRHAYARARAHNAVIEYDRASMEFGRGSLDADIRKSASRVMEAMEAALRTLDGHIQGGKG